MSNDVKTWSFQWFLRKPNVAREQKQMRPAGVTALECVLCHSQRSTKQPNAFRVAEDGVQAGKTTPEAKLTGSHIPHRRTSWSSKWNLCSMAFIRHLALSSCHWARPDRIPLAPARKGPRKSKKYRVSQICTERHLDGLGWSWMHLNNNIVRILPWICNEH